MTDWFPLARGAAAALLLLALLTPAAFVKGTSAAIRLHSGGISGETLEGSVRVFRGIPFAAPPVGDLPPRPPRDVSSWEGRPTGHRVRCRLPSATDPGADDRREAARGQRGLPLPQRLDPRP